ncbi:hypothetical protein SAMN05421841_1969 [Chryseobacterium wanjuense]|uniref:Uncharacterized protein n=1 Tax=Chryseobacterium wanjuense TaxID=356305 RepID=A0A1I0QKB9_9FLAO|nr:hypothetical protein [Chryseobacterium wanjuense]SEW27587.1 hypothetical protein SAMN05421841_1969 [Chryseobacterium wanjuense]
MEEQDNVTNEPVQTQEGDLNTNEPINANGSTENLISNNGSTPTAPVDPPPTTSPQGAGEIIKPTERIEKNPKKR